MAKYFSGWFELRYAGDPATTLSAYLNCDFPGGSVVTLDRAGTWIITVRPWLGANEGYEILLSELEPTPAPRFQLLGTSKAGFVVVNLTTDQHFYGSRPTKVRLWAEGLGFIAEQRFEPAAIFKLKLPTTTNIRLRAQLLYGDSPGSSATKSLSIRWQE